MSVLPKIGIHVKLNKFMTCLSEHKTKLIDYPLKSSCSFLRKINKLQALHCVHLTVKNFIKNVLCGEKKKNVESPKQIIH